MPRKRIYATDTERWAAFYKRRKETMQLVKKEEMYEIWLLLDRLEDAAGVLHSWGDMPEVTPDAPSMIAFLRAMVEQFERKVEAISQEQAAEYDALASGEVVETEQT